MTDFDENCRICNGTADKEFKRVEVWSNNHWRLTMTTYKSVKGLCYLEPKRHIRYITELDGEESLTFGSIVSKCSKIIKDIFQAQLVYVYIYGGHIPHLHVHLAPHTEDDIFFDDVVKNEGLISDEIIGVSEITSLKEKFKTKIT